MKRGIKKGLIFILVLMLASSAFAVRLLTEEKAIEKMFPNADEIMKVTLTLEGDALTAVKNRLGGNLIEFQQESESESVNETMQYTFIYAMKGGEKVGVALIDHQPGKWGPVEYIIALDAKTAKVTNMAVMSYSEKRGRPIARNNFLSQFIGLGSGDDIMVKKDIRAISGATISSKATCFAVRKVITIYEEAVLNKLAKP